MKSLIFLISTLSTTIFAMPGDYTVYECSKGKELKCIINQRGEFCQETGHNCRPPSIKNIHRQSDSIEDIFQRYQNFNSVVLDCKESIIENKRNRKYLRIDYKQHLRVESGTLDDTEERIRIATKTKLERILYKTIDLELSHYVANRSTYYFSEGRSLRHTIYVFTPNGQESIYNCLIKTTHKKE